jgi:hypothetical protein
LQGVASQNEPSPEVPFDTGRTKKILKNKNEEKREKKGEIWRRETHDEWYAAGL